MLLSVGGKEWTVYASGKRQKRDEVNRSEKWREQKGTKTVEKSEAYKEMREDAARELQKVDNLKEGKQSEELYRVQV